MPILRNATAVQARLSTTDRASARGYAIHKPVKPNRFGRISKQGIKKIIWRDDATTRDGIAFPVA